MCIKWIKNTFKYEKILEEKENNENHDKNKISNEQEKKLLDVLDEVGIEIGKNFDIKKFKEKLDPSVITFP